MKIRFYPASREIASSVPPPRPAREYIPEWYARTPMYRGGVPDIRLDSGFNSTVKACTPFGDALRSGYIQETWCDLWIKWDDVEGLTYHYSAQPDMVIFRGGPQVPVGPDFYDAEFAWKAPWIPRVPKGYSILYTHPLNHLHLPTISGAGIVDSDTFYHSGSGNFPFYVRKNFTGIIPRGTPMYQMIPVKRDDWESVIEPWDEDEHSARVRLLQSLYLNRYRRQFHHKKRFR